MRDEIRRGLPTAAQLSVAVDMHTYAADIELEEALICVTADEIAGEPGPTGTG